MHLEITVIIYIDSLCSIDTFRPFRKETFRRLWSEPTPKRYNEPFETAKQLRPRTSTLALKCAGTIKAISEGPRPPVASCNCRRDASWRPHDFSPAISVRCFYDAIPRTAFRQHGGYDVYLVTRLKKTTPVHSSPVPTDYEKRHPVAGGSLRQKESRLPGSFYPRANASTNASADACPFSVPGEIKISPIFQGYSWETRNAASLTFQSPRGSYDSLFGVIQAFINVSRYLYHILHIIYCIIYIFF